MILVVDQDEVLNKEQDLGFHCQNLLRPKSKT